MLSATPHWTQPTAAAKEKDRKCRAVRHHLTDAHDQPNLPCGLQTVKGLCMAGWEDC